MQLYSFWQALPRAFYCKTLYQDVDQNWHGIGLRYLLLVCFICSLPFLYVSHNYAVRLTDNLNAIAVQLPMITIKNGEVSIDKPVPYAINDPATNKTVAIIDTREKSLSKKLDSKIFMFISKDKLSINAAGKITKLYDLSDIKEFVIDKTKVDSWTKRLSIALFVGCYIFAIAVYFIPSLLVILFYAAIAKVFVRTEHTYSELCRLAAVALTPTLTFILLLGAININVPYSGIIYVMLSLGYLSFAIEANRHHPR